MSARFAFLDHSGVLAFAHRGGTTGGPENTMPAFQHAIDLGYVYLETDVHLSADDVLYAFHDSNLAARTGTNANFSDLQASQIDALIVDGVAAIPRLDDVLASWPQARVNIDLKSDAAVLPLIDSLRSHRAIDRVCVGSFVDRRIKKCRAELGPQLCTSMGKFEASRLMLAAKRLANPLLLTASCAQIPPRRHVDVTTAAVVNMAHEHDIQVHVWTLNEPDEIRQALELGVDGIMTDRPAVLRDALINHGVWAPEGVSR